MSLPVSESCTEDPFCTVMCPLQCEAHVPLPSPRLSPGARSGPFGSPEPSTGCLLGLRGNERQLFFPFSPQLTSFLFLPFPAPQISFHVLPASRGTLCPIGIRNSEKPSIDKLPHPKRRHETCRRAEASLRFHGVLRSCSRQGSPLRLHLLFCLRGWLATDCGSDPLPP